MESNFHDIIPPERRSIRNVTASPRRARRGGAPDSDATPRERHDRRPPEPPHKGRGSTRNFFSRFGLWFAAGAGIVVFILAFSLLFSGTTLTITPKERDVTVRGEFESFRTSGAGVLAHEIVTVDRTAEREVPATGEQEVETRASGTIVIFNDFNSSEQRLITNTRFETPDGLIYRIDEPVVVPGQQTLGGETVPGSIEVTVYADEPGANYNIGLTDFTIPGFKGSPRFEGFFARSRTPMTGGFVGTKLVAEPTTVENARAELRTSLEQKLMEQAESEVPDGFYLFPNASFITYESLPDRGANDTVGVSEKATLHGIIYRTDDLSRFIATQTVAGYDGEPVLLEDPSSLTYTLADEELLRPWEADSVQFVLRGDGRLVWQYDAESLRNDLAGRSKDALPTILSGYPSIREANVALRPFWRRTFPTDPEKIMIERVQ